MEKIEIVDLYFSKKRKCIKNETYFMIDDNRFILKKNEKKLLMNLLDLEL